MANGSSKRIKEDLLLRAYLKTNDPSHLTNFPNSVPLWHLEMLKDTDRLNFYNHAIAALVRDKIVLDLGTGSGILTYLALKHGARKVYSVEVDPVFQEIYSVLLEEAITAGKARLIKKDILNCQLEDLDHNVPEVVIHELFGSELFAEQIIQVFDELKQKSFFNEATKFIPSRCKLMGEEISSETRFQDDFAIKDFEGFPLSRLTNLGITQNRYRNYNETHKITATKTSAPQIIYEAQFPEIPQTEDLRFNLSGHQDSTHLRTWIILESGDHHLESHHEKVKSHWTNSFFELPVKRPGQKFHQAKFTVRNNQFTLLKFV